MVLVAAFQSSNRISVRAATSAACVPSFRALRQPEDSKSSNSESCGTSRFLLVCFVRVMAKRKGGMSNGVQHAAP
jgi:hypothetical protein